jgi:hypothetical protein
MSLTTTTNKQQHTANGSTTAFSFPYKFNVNSDLVVVLTNLTTGVSTTQVIVTDYAVSGAGNPAGGTVTFVTAPANALRVTITREVPYTQEVDYQPDDDFPAEVHEAALDKLTMIGQQLNTEFDYALKQPTTDANPIGILPTAAVRANKYLVFDVNGDPQATASTSATSDIVNGTVTPAKLSTGGPNWDASGNVTATSFIGNVTGNVTGAGNSTFAGTITSGASVVTNPSTFGAGASLTNTGAGGRSWVLNSNGSSNGGGAGAFLIYDATAPATRLSIDTTGKINTQTNPITNCPTTCKAWVNFNGTTATPSTIRSSYNVSSVTKVSTGSYVCNFSTALSDANYSVCFATSPVANVYYCYPQILSQSASSLSITCPASGDGARFADASILCVQIFGN